MNPKHWNTYDMSSGGNFGPETVRDYIHYVYFRELPPSEERRSGELLTMAVMYEVVHLRDSLVDHLEKNLTRENVADVLKASEVCQIPRLTKAVHQFLQEEIASLNEIPGLDAVFKKYPQCQKDFDIYSQMTKVVNSINAMKAQMEEERKEWKEELKELEAKIEQVRQDMEAKMELERQDMEAKMEQERKELEAKMEEERKEWKVKREEERTEWEAKLNQERKEWEAKLNEKCKEQIDFKSLVAEVENKIEEVLDFQIIPEAP